MNPKATEQHPILDQMLATLNARQLALYEERAAILEFDAGIERSLAETLALLDLIRREGWPPPSK